LLPQAISETLPFLAVRGILDGILDAANISGPDSFTKAR